MTSKPGPLDGLTVGSGVRYVNGVTSDRMNTHTLPSYTLVDLAVGYDLSEGGADRGERPAERQQPDGRKLRGGL